MDPRSPLVAAFKARRKARGWSREQLAERAGIDVRVVQLVELSAWTELEAIERMDQVLLLAEQGAPDPRLPPPSRPVQAGVGDA